MVIEMTEKALYLCGCWEYEDAKENGEIGKCIACIHHKEITNSTVNCELNGKIKEKEDCKDWSIDIR